MSYSSRGSRRIAANMLLRGGKLWRNPVVEISPEGEVLSIVTDSDRDVCSGAQMDSSVSTEFFNGIMLAGFVNAHSHLELSYLEGQIEPRAGFAAFAAQIGQVRDKFTMEQRLHSLERSIVDMERGGVVAVADIINGDTSFDAKLRSKIEYHNFAELFGLRTIDLSAVEPLLSRPNTTATLHSLYSLNDQALSEIVRASSDDVPLSIHFMESESEQQLYDHKGGLYDWYSRVGFECDFLHYGSPAERLVALVPKGRRVMLVHNCYVTQRDIDVVMNHFTTEPYWVLCPRSNDYISSVQPPVELLRRNNLNICIGTDSLASNWSLSIIDELKMLSSVPLVERLDWATRKGAEALGMSHLGDIEVGRKPHINILSGIDYDTMQLGDRTSIRRIV